MNQTTEMFLESACLHMEEGDKYMKNRNMKKAEPDLALSEYKKGGKDYKSCNLMACASCAFEFAAEAGIISSLPMSVAVNYREAADCCEIAYKLGMTSNSLLPIDAPENIRSCSSMIDDIIASKKKPAKKSSKYDPIKPNVIAQESFEEASEVKETFYTGWIVGATSIRCFHLYKLAGTHFGLAGKFVDMAQMYAKAAGYAPDFESYQACASESVEKLLMENKPMQAFLTSIEFCERLALEAADLRELSNKKLSLKIKGNDRNACGLSNDSITVSVKNMTKEDILKKSDVLQRSAADAAVLCRKCLNPSEYPEQINKAAFMSVIIALISNDVTEADSCFSYFADFSSQLAEMAEDLIEAVRAKDEEKLKAAKKLGGKYFLSANAMRVVQFLQFENDEDEFGVEDDEFDTKAQSVTPKTTTIVKPAAKKGPDGEKKKLRF